MNSIVEDLLRSPEEINPAIVMQRRLVEIEKSSGMTHLDMVRLAPQVQKAMALGDKEAHAATDALDSLRGAPAMAGSIVPTGF